MAGWLANLWYQAVYGLSFVLMLFGFSLRYQGGRRIPLRGPALLIANHESYLDPIVVGLASPRRLGALARKTLFRNPVFAAMIRALGAVPVDQEGVAKEGLKTVLSCLEEGKAILVFPEGERCWHGKMQPLKPGVSLLIKRVRAPIVPIGIAGAYDALPRTRRWPMLAPLFLPATRGALAVVVGRPLDAARYAGLSREEVLQELFVELQKVQARAERLRRKP